MVSLCWTFEKTKTKTKQIIQNISCLHKLWPIEYVSNSSSSKAHVARNKIKSFATFCSIISNVYVGFWVFRECSNWCSQGFDSPKTMLGFFVFFFLSNIAQASIGDIISSELIILWPVTNYPRHKIWWPLKVNFYLK